MSFVVVLLCVASGLNRLVEAQDLWECEFKTGTDESSQFITFELTPESEVTLCKSSRVVRRISIDDFEAALEAYNLDPINWEIVSSNFMGSDGNLVSSQVKTIRINYAVYLMFEDKAPIRRQYDVAGSRAGGLKGEPVTLPNNSDTFVEVLLPTSEPASSVATIPLSVAKSSEITPKGQRSGVYVRFSF